MAAKLQPEARSLSTINYLAANPPQYPHHPELRESLTLYISRVPGTQGAVLASQITNATALTSYPDIILSTFRPQKKNVTGEDIANSLYYVHLDLPEDGLLAAPRRQESAAAPRASSESTRSAIPRKPLPASAKVPKPESTHGAVNSGVAPSLAPSLGSAFVAPTSADSAPPLSSEPRREESAVEGYRENPMFRKRRSAGPLEAADHHLPAPSEASMQWKALGSAPRSASTTGPDGGRHAPSDMAAQGRPVTPTQPRTLATHPGGQVVRVTSPGDPLDSGGKPSPGQLGRRRPSSVAFSLAIIRRDPTSGTQCNVGKVSSFQTNVPTPDTADPSLDPDHMGGLLVHAQKIGIRLDSSGYAKYRDMPRRANVDALRPLSGHSFAQQALQGSTGPGRERASSLKPAARPGEDGFSRQVIMSYGASWASNFKKAFHRRDRPGSPVNANSTSPEESIAQKPFHVRHGSASTIGSVDSADDSASPPLITHPGPGLRPKGYVFLSPWDGRCEFRTSPNGRSLKLRHTLDPASARIDPRELAQSIREAQAMGRSRGDELSSALLGAKPVSELRFNLPNGTPHRAPDRSGAPKTGRWDANHLSGHFSKLLHHRSRSSDEESDDDYEYGEGDGTPMDLSLGKEHAGGGTRGRRAKLGKLIIHDEGLKMLDLVVAANVGVWWTTWGRML